MIESFYYELSRLARENPAAHALWTPVASSDGNLAYFPITIGQLLAMSTQVNSLLPEQAGLVYKSLTPNSIILISLETSLITLLVFIEALRKGYKVVFMPLECVNPVDIDDILNDVDPQILFLADRQYTILKSMTTKALVNLDLIRSHAHTLPMTGESPIFAPRELVEDNRICYLPHPDDSTARRFTWLSDRDLLNIKESTSQIRTQALGDIKNSPSTIAVLSPIHGFYDFCVKVIGCLSGTYSIALPPTSSPLEDDEHLKFLQSQQPHLLFASESFCSADLYDEKFRSLVRQSPILRCADGFAIARGKGTELRGPEERSHGKPNLWTLNAKSHVQDSLLVWKVEIQRINTDVNCESSNEKSTVAASSESSYTSKTSGTENAAILGYCEEIRLKARVVAETGLHKNENNVVTVWARLHEGVHEALHLARISANILGAVEAAALAVGLSEEVMTLVVVSEAKIPETRWEELCENVFPGIRRTRDRSKLTRMIRFILSRVLDREIQYIDDETNFFSWWMCSVHVSVLVDMVEELCGVTLRPVDFYDYPCVKRLVDYILSVQRGVRIVSVDHQERRAKILTLINQSRGGRETRSALISLFRDRREIAVFERMRKTAFEYLNELRRLPPVHTSLSTSRMVVLITGVSGTLGMNTVFHLLDMKKKQKRDIRIIGLFRGGDPSRLKALCKERKLDYSLIDQMVECFDLNLSDPHLGLAPHIFDQLAGEVTHVVHTAWRLSFSTSLEKFENDCVHSLLVLIKFCASKSVKQFWMISSISAILNYSPLILSDGATEGKDIVDPDKTGIPEEFFGDSQVVMAAPIGYGLSKVLAEQICHKAKVELGLPVAIVRLGVISGDSRTGVWPAKEVIPIVSIMGISEKFVQPFYFISGGFIPGNIAGVCLSELVMSGKMDRFVYHLSNPNGGSWKQWNESLWDNGFRFKLITQMEFYRTITQTQKTYLTDLLFKPALQIPYEIGIYAMRQLATTETLKATETLSDCPRVNTNLTNDYIKYWGEHYREVVPMYRS